MKTQQTFSPWFRLARLPNLLTVPGDAIAGFLLASAFSGRQPDLTHLLAAAGAALCLYVFGLFLNDIVDVETDRLERPERPLPSGEITVPQARMAAIAMVLSGLNLALVAGRFALYAAAVLAGLILLYNGMLKQRPVVGVMAMGLCRGVGLLLGAASAGVSPLSPADVPALAAAGGLAVYVAAFSALAKHEMEPEKVSRAVRWLPFAALLFCLPAVLAVAAAFRPLPPLLPFVYVFLMVMTLLRAWLLGGLMYRHQPIPATVGGHIRNLLMVQACFCVAAGMAGLLPALTLVLLSFVFPRVAARFTSS
jgi:4-hydroxybenzoate polyprenyltransferase